jgi:O-antigen/teichoic acid export membrane protein
MSYFSEPPYFLLVAGLLVALTCGTAFAATLKQIVQKWSNDRASKSIAKLRIGGLLLVPFLGICAGVCIFLFSGLEIFGFPAWLSYAVAVPLTLLLGLLVWLQLGSMLALVERQGFQAIDIDSWPKGDI